MRCWSRAKLVTRPSKATISPSTTKSRAAWLANASVISGYWAVTASRFRDIQRTRPPRRKARHRSPSSLRSKIHAGSENRRSVRVASIGATHAGCGPGMRSRRVASGSDSSRLVRGSITPGLQERALVLGDPDPEPTVPLGLGRVLDHRDDPGGHEPARSNRLTRPGHLDHLDHASGGRYLHPPARS